MAGSLVQVPTVAFASTSTQGGHGDAAQRWHRFRILAGFLHVVCRLVVVSGRWSFGYHAPITETK